MEYYLPHELGADWLGKTNRFSAAREKQYILKEEEEVLHPFFFYGKAQARPNGGKQYLV